MSLALSPEKRSNALVEALFVLEESFRPFYSYYEEESHYYKEEIRVFIC